MQDSIEIKNISNVNEYEWRELFLDIDNKITTIIKMMINNDNERE